MQIEIPDIGVDQAIVAEILVKVGDIVTAEQSLLLLESDKAAVEVPSPVAGTIREILVSTGVSVQQGQVAFELEQAVTENSEASAEVATSTVKTAPSPVTPTDDSAPSNSTPEKATQSDSATLDPSNAEQVAVSVPDIGVEKAIVSEILVKVGDRIAADQSIVLLESDKAAVEVPSPVSGEVLDIQIQQGDTVKEGVVLLNVSVQTQRTPQSQPQPKQQSSTNAHTNTNVSAETVAVLPASTDGSTATSTTAIPNLTTQQQTENAQVYAGPAVRQLARQLGVVLSEVKASGAHGRIVKEDVFAYVKSRLNAPVDSAQANRTAVSSLPALPSFENFGGGELKQLTRLQQVSIPQLSLNNFIPQVTQFDLADITELEAWRESLKSQYKAQGISLTILAFIAKVVAHLLKKEPYFAGHLSDDAQSVLLRNEIHMGIAVATAEGLTVPVLRHPDQKSIQQIAMELMELSQKARDKKLSPKDLQGANFSITSLGSIGGTAFTPLVNWPQVAILGISPASMQPVWDGQHFEPRLMLPLSLSYDHRVINGADAARFSHQLTLLLKDIRQLLL